MALRDWILRVMPPRMREGVIAESRRWQTTCRACRHVSSIWEIGGLRGGAAGKKVIGTRCAVCGKFGAHDVVYR